MGSRISIACPFTHLGGRLGVDAFYSAGQVKRTGVTTAILLDSDAIIGWSTMDVLKGLNEEQRKAAETVEGPLLIVAGPGTGKTRVITHRIAYLVKACGVSPYRIVAMTFTNKAAREMRERLQRQLGESAANLTLGTFHAVCAGFLRRDGDRIGLDRGFMIYDDDDQMTLIKRSMEEYEIDPKRFGPRAIQSAISRAKSSLLDAEGYSLRRGSYLEEVVSRVFKRYQELLNRNKAVDFDDLLLKTYQMFSGNEDVLKKYQDRYVHVLVDEFQDTNVPQYQIARQMAGKHRNICVVGDPDQSIYSWRNADIRNILDFKKDYPEARVVALEKNYRSTGTILSAAQSVIAVNRQRVEKGLWTANDDGILIEMAEGYNEEEEAQMAIREVERLVDEGHRRDGIAIMYRVNAQSRALEEACLRYGVPYQIIGGLRFYQRREVKDVIAYLRLLINPHDDVSLTRIINVPTRGIGQRTMDELVRWARNNGSSVYSAIEAVSQGDGSAPTMAARSARAVTDFQGMLEALTAVSHQLDVVQTVDTVLERTGYKRFVQEDERGEERWENVMEFRGLAREFETMEPLEGLTTFLESVSLSSDVDTMEDRTDSVTLITLHQAKGLEFPAVFIVGIEEDLLPHVRSVDDPGQLEEERRLFYVGMTRAKERLYLYRAFRRRMMGGGKPGLASRFLRDIPPHLIASPAPIPTRPVPSVGSGSGSISPRRWATTWSASRQAASAVPEAKAGIKTGDKVRHAKFGDGVVVSCSPSGQDVEVTVAFVAGNGVKRLLLSYAPLEKVERQA